MEIKLGRLRSDEDNKRDAVYVALLPVVAFDKVYPGQPIGFAETGNNSLVSGMSDEKIGIVDPFLGGAVYPGEQFWMFMFPNSVTDMQHHWTCPSVDGTPLEDRDSSIEYLSNFAGAANMTYDDLIERVSDYCENVGKPWIEQGSMCAQEAWYDIDGSEFWAHFKTVTGFVPPTDADWPVPFSCSC